jgi:hypothetical protein
MTREELRLAALEDDGGRSPAALGPNIGRRLRALQIKEILDQVVRDNAPIVNVLKKFGSGSFNDVYDTGERELLKVPKLYGDKPQTLLESIPKRQVLVDNDLAPNYNFGLKQIQFSPAEKKIIPYVVEQQLYDPRSKFPGITERRFNNFLSNIGQTGLEPEDVTWNSHWHGVEPRNFGADSRGKFKTYDPDLFEWHGMDPSDLEQNIHEAMPRYIQLDEKGLDPDAALKHLLEKIRLPK